MPRAEQVATVLLQLATNPSLFEKWAAQEGQKIKPDGQVFARVEWSGPVKVQSKYVPIDRPTRYLKRIVALTGARKVHGERYILAAGRKYFLVDAKFVHLLSRGGKSTCFSLLADLDTPNVEIVASALLQLKNNPKQVLINTFFRILY